MTIALLVEIVCDFWWYDPLYFSTICLCNHGNHLLQDILHIQRSSPLLVGYWSRWVIDLIYVLLFLPQDFHAKEYWHCFVQVVMNISQRSGVLLDHTGQTWIVKFYTSIFSFTNWSRIIISCFAREAVNCGVCELYFCMLCALKYILKMPKYCYVLVL